MKRRIGVLMTVSGTMLLVLSMVLSTVAFASNGRGIASGPGADVKYMPPQQEPCEVYTQCDDANPCTHDICNNGTCEHSAVPGCRTCTGDADCADADPCTSNEACYDGLCVHTIVGDCRTCTSDDDCYDGDCDGYDICAFGHCGELAPLCQDAFACTDDHCVQGEPRAVTCEYEENDSNCADGNACTEDLCLPSYSSADENGSVYHEAECYDGNECTIDSCNPAAREGEGCTYTPIDPAVVCDDDNPCSTDSCDPEEGCMNEFPDPYECSNCDSCPCAGGHCVYDYGADVWECVAEPCDDGVACTIDWCSEEGCEHDDNCDDGIACSEDWCHEEEGCLHDYSDCGECTPGASRACGSDIGECSPGAQACGSDRKWGACGGGVGPSLEVCDGRDNDCDGVADDGDCCATMLGSPGGRR